LASNEVCDPGTGCTSTGGQGRPWGDVLERSAPKAHPCPAPMPVPAPVPMPMPVPLLMPLLMPGPVLMAPPMPVSMGSRALPETQPILRRSPRRPTLGEWAPIMG
jgi:hypothetical protein